MASGVTLDAMTSNRHSGPHGGQDFGAQWWEQHYQDTGAGPAGQPSAHLVAAVVGVTPGAVLEAGCGTDGSAPLT